MKNFSLSLLSDKKLEEILKSSIFSYTDSMLQSNKIIQQQSLSFLNSKNILNICFNKSLIQFQIDKNSPISEDNLLKISKEFITLFKESKEYSDLHTKVSNSFSKIYLSNSKFENIQKSSILNKSKNDADILIDRILVDFLAKKFSLNSNNTFFKKLEQEFSNSSNLISFNFSKKTLTENNSVFFNEINEIKLKMVSKEIYKSSVPVLSSDLELPEKTSFRLSNGSVVNLISDDTGNYSIVGKDINHKFSLFVTYDEKNNQQLNVSFKNSLKNESLSEYSKIQYDIDIINPILKKIIHKVQQKSQSPLQVNLNGFGINGSIVELFLSKNKNTENLHYTGVSIGSIGNIFKKNKITETLNNLTKKAEQNLSPILASGISITNDFISNNLQLTQNFAKKSIKSIADNIIDFGEKRKMSFFTKLGLNTIKKIIPESQIDTRLTTIQYDCDFSKKKSDLFNFKEKQEVVLTSSSFLEKKQLVDYFNEIIHETFRRPSLVKKYPEIDLIHKEFASKPYIENFDNPQILQKTINSITLNILKYKEYNNTTKPLTKPSFTYA